LYSVKKHICLANLQQQHYCSDKSLIKQVIFSAALLFRNFVENFNVVRRGRGISEPVGRHVWRGVPPGLPAETASSLHRPHDRLRI